MNEAEKLINRLYGNIGFTCDNCGRETYGITYVNGMKFCAKCYHQIFGKDNQQTEITQLKQQLTEKQNTIDEINKEFVQAVHDWKTLCAEKDKEIERLKNLSELNNEVVINQGKEIFDLRVQVLQQKQNQTQLAIQELEKVKSSLFSKAIQITGTGVDCVRLYEINKIIDQQIKELSNNTFKCEICGEITPKNCEGGEPNVCAGCVPTETHDLSTEIEPQSHENDFLD